MKKVLVGVLAGCLVAGAAMAATNEVYSANVVGYFTVDINGNAWNLLAVPMTKIPAYRGRITAADATTITDDDASFGPLWEGVTGVESNGASTFYIEIADTNAAAHIEGRHMYIQTNDATSVTIKDGVPADITPAELVGLSYKIIAANRVRDVFGGAGNGDCVIAGGAAGDADQLVFWGGATWDAAVYYKTSGAPSSRWNNWVQGSTIVNDQVIDRDEAFFVKRGAVNDTNIVVTGEVSKNSQNVVFAPGFNLVGGGFVVDENIGDTTLDTVVTGGAAGDADQVITWGGATWNPVVYYKTSGAPSSRWNKWVQGSTVVDDSFPINASQGFFIKAGSTFTWPRQSPLQDD